MSLRRRVSPTELLGHIQAIVRDDPDYGDTQLPPLEIIPKPDLIESANWWIGPFDAWEEREGQREAIYRAIRSAQERFDIEWNGVQRERGKTT